MKTAELRHFELNCSPFSKEIDDTELWLPTSKKSLVDSLVDAMQAHESVLLTGEPGVGKTCVLRALRHRLPPGQFRLTYCSNVTLGRRDFYRQLCQALGLAPSATAAAVFNAVSTNIEQLANDRIHPVFLLDESQLMNQDVLDHLHILMNFDWDSRALLSLILVGLTDLHDKLRLHRNRALYSRLQHRLHIDPMTVEDTAEYIAARLESAGTKRDVFTSDAISMIHEAASGSLRDVDRVATHGLRAAYRAKKKLVERNHLVQIIEVAA